MEHKHPPDTVINGRRVTLNAEDLGWATDVGRMRNLEAILSGRTPKFDEARAGELWGNHIESACAELAVARLGKQKWMGHINRFRGLPDIEDTNWEVRWSAIQKWKVNASDDTGKVVVCVDLKCPTYEVVGWVIPELVRRVPEFERTGKNRNGQEHKYWLVPKDRITRLGVPPVAVLTGEHWKP